MGLGHICHGCDLHAGVTCTVSGRPFAEHIDAKRCPRERFPIGGVGDFVAKVAQVTGIKRIVGDCPECDRRREELNRRWG